MAENITRCLPTTAAVYCDLSLHIHFKLCCIKYWFKVVNKSDSTIVKKVYNMHLSLNNMGFTKQTGCLAHLISSNLVTSPEIQIKTHSPKLKLKMPSKLQDFFQPQFIQSWLIEMQNKAK